MLISLLELVILKPLGCAISIFLENVKIQNGACVAVIPKRVNSIMNGIH
jgi:hypothetical protein